MRKLISKQENFEYKFQTSNSGICAVLISASCKRGLLGFKEEDLRVEIDDIKLREVPAKKKPQYYDIPSTWNGSKLKGLTKTVIFILNLKKGDHIIKFFPKNSATLEKEPEIIEFENPNDIQINLNQQAQDGNRRPWITLALIDLPLRILDTSIKCEKRFVDSDDVQIIIDGKIQKNENPNKWGKNWRWQGRQIKGAIIDERFYLDLEKSDHYIEFWADRIPTLDNFWVYLGVEQSEEKANMQAVPKTSNEIIEKINELYAEVGMEIKFEKIPVPVKNFTKYDKEIKIASKEFNVDPDILKATIAQESRFGKEIEHDGRYVGKSGFMGMEKTMSIAQLEKIGYKFNYNDIADIVRASAAYYAWLKKIEVSHFKDSDNPLKLYTQYRINLMAKAVDTAGIKQFLFYYFYYKE